MLGRREFLTASLGALCPCFSWPSKAAMRVRAPCFFKISDLSDAGLSGFSLFDFSSPLEYDVLNGLVFVLNELNTRFSVIVAAGLYNDTEEFPNAGADPTLVLDLRMNRRGTDGTIAIGKHLLAKLSDLPKVKVSGGLAEDDLSTALTAICAHEYGHILQKKFIIDEPQAWSRLVDLGDTKCMVGLELHADFICGVFGKIRKDEDSEYNAVAQARTQWTQGDPNTHGTNEQRGWAVAAGFSAASKGRFTTPKDITLVGLDYILSSAAWDAPA